MAADQKKSFEGIRRYLKGFAMGKLFVIGWIVLALVSTEVLLRLVRKAPHMDDDR